MLRPGELVMGATSAYTLCVQHVSQTAGYSVILPPSRASATQFSVQLVARPDITACPVSAVREYAAVSVPGRVDKAFRCE